MAIDTRNIVDSVSANLALQFNRLAKVVAALGTTFHADISSSTSGNSNALTATAISVTGAATADLAAVLVKANLAKKIYNVHLADARAHKIADAVNVIATADATDQTTANTLLNAIKAALNLHYAQSGIHYTNDGTNTIAAADATTLNSSRTLADAIQAGLNAHIISAPAVSLLNVLAP